MRFRAAFVIACTLALLCAGCGGSDRQQVSKLISTMRQAQQSGDAEKACKDVYVVQERTKPAGEEKAKDGGEEADGGECEVSFRAAVAQREASLESLSSKLLDVRLDGEKGTAVVHTTGVRKDGSSFARDDDYDVVRTEEGWRVRIAGEG
jgi:hypothetical protein